MTTTTTTTTRKKSRGKQRAVVVLALCFLCIFSRSVAFGQEEYDDADDGALFTGGEEDKDATANGFWNTGPSGIDESILPPLNPTNYPCPKDRYLLLGPRTYTGGFNNMFMTFQSAILLARYTNRTFVIPAARNDRYTDFRFSQAIDYEVRALCIFQLGFSVCARFFYRVFVSFHRAGALGVAYV